MKIRNIILSVIVLLIFLTFLVKTFKQTDLRKMSPKQVMALYLKARNDGDFETLRKIIFFPPETSEEEKTYRAQAATSGPDEKGVAAIALARIKAEYGTIIDEETVEVGLVIITGISRRTPFQQIIMKKDERIWKYEYDKFVFTEEQLIETIRETPDEAWPYYYLGRLYQPENPVRLLI